MRIEVLIRLEGDYDEDAEYVPDVFYLHRVESLAFTPEQNEDTESYLAGLSQQIEGVIDGTVQEARNRLALIGDYLKRISGQ